DSDLPSRWVTSLRVDPTDANVAFVSYSGYHAADNTPYVLATLDGGDDWVDITGNLPQAPVNSLTLGPQGELIAATDIGVFATVDTGVSWFEVGASLPTSPAMATTFHLPTRELTAATFGRGLWSASLPIYDRDGDGVPDARDRCLETANAAQTDTDGDGFGNACDADFNNDCAVNVIDLGLFRNGFFGANPLYDLSGDGAVNVIDLGILRTLFFRAPGPSGRLTDCR
ncbi:MAG: thrombospondin type 3 repeat-containing protein, partial [Pseudomonadota bacterium]